MWPLSPKSLDLSQTSMCVALKFPIHFLPTSHLLSFLLSAQAPWLAARFSITSGQHPLSHFLCSSKTGCQVVHITPVPLFSTPPDKLTGPHIPEGFSVKTPGKVEQECKS